MFSIRPFMCSKIRLPHVLAIASIIWLEAVPTQAQIIYLSDNRSVSAAVMFNTNSVPPGGFSYSGDYSATAVQSSPFTDFYGNLGGSVLVSYDNGGYLHATVSASQNSVLNAQGISYSSTVTEGGNRYPDSFLESSFLQVIFMVSDAVIYDLTCQRGPDPFFSSESWMLSSANLGVLVSTPALNGPNNGYGPAASYSGLLVPGDTYTLTLQEIGGIAPPPYADYGGLQVTFAVPEPSVGWLLGLGLGGLVAFRLKRSQKPDPEL